MATQDEGQLVRKVAYDSGAVSGSKHKILVGIAPRSQPFDESMDSLDTAMAHAFRSGIEIVVGKIFGGVPGFQNWGPTICTMLKDPTITHIFAAADDMLYPTDILTRLAGHNKDVICAIYRKGVADAIEPANWVPYRETFLERFREGGVYETERASGHTMLIQRHVIEKMVADYPELAYDSLVPGEQHYALSLPMIHNSKVMHDDWAFSYRARQSGFTLWDDYGCRCRHYCGHFVGFEELEAEMFAENTKAASIHNDSGVYSVVCQSCDSPLSEQYPSQRAVICNSGKISEEFKKHQCQ